MKRKYNKKLLTAAGAVAGVALGATMALAAHRPVTLYTYEELATQFGMPKMPVMVDANGKGMPYSPKQTCGTPGQFADGTASACHDYGNISGHSFHSNQGLSELLDRPSATYTKAAIFGDATAGSVTTEKGQFVPTRNKPFTQSVGMIGKW